MAIIEGFGWAQNRSKLERAITEVRESGKPITDKAVKAVYVRLLGAVIEVKEEEMEDEEEAAKEAGKEAKKAEKAAVAAAKKAAKEAKK